MSEHTTSPQVVLPAPLGSEYRLHADVNPGCGCMGRLQVVQRVNRKLVLAVCDQCDTEYGVRPRDVLAWQRTHALAGERWWDR